MTLRKYSVAPLCAVCMPMTLSYTVLYVDSLNLETSLNLSSLYEWASFWQLEINPGKCQTLHLGLKNPGLIYEIGENKIKNYDEVKDLVVITDSMLKYSAHINTRHIVTKSMALVRQFTRSMSI